MFDTQLTSCTEADRELSDVCCLFGVLTLLSCAHRQASEEEVTLARAARLKRFEDQRASYADIMRQAAGGWTPEADSGDGVGDEAAVGAAGVESSEGLRHRGHATNNE